MRGFLIPELTALWQLGARRHDPATRFYIFLRGPVSPAAPAPSWCVVGGSMWTAWGERNLSLARFGPSLASGTGGA
jgi:hypothetical protein